MYEVELKDSGHNYADTKGLLPTLFQQRRRTVLILCPGMLWKEEHKCICV